MKEISTWNTWWYWQWCFFSKKKKNDKAHWKASPWAWLKTLIGLFMKKKQTKCTAPPVKYAKLANRSNPVYMYIEWSSRTQKGNLKQPINCCCCFRQVIFWFRQTNPKWNIFLQLATFSWVKIGIYKQIFDL